MSDLVKKAILQSARTNAPVHLDALDLAHAGLTSASVCAELEEACEDFAQHGDGDVKEFFGKSLSDEGDAETWRVHVELDT